MKIRSDQIEVFRSAAQGELARALRRGLAREFPQCESLNCVDELNAFVRLGVERAAAHELRLEDEIQRYLWLMMLFGADWERDPQCSWAAARLAPREGSTPADRIAGLWRQACDWRERVRGPNDSRYRAALGSLDGRSVDDLCKNPSRSQRDLLFQLASMWPSKVTEIGEQPLCDLTRLAVEACKPHQLMDRWAVVLFAELMFLFGAGFVADPLHPWAAQALAAHPADSIDRRLERLLTAAQRAVNAA